MRLQYYVAFTCFVTGNPGIIEFYKDFMKTIYEELDGEVPVWGISHAGHLKMPANMKAPPLSGIILTDFFYVW